MKVEIIKKTPYVILGEIYEVEECQYGYIYPVIFNINILIPKECVKIIDE